jgi:hypothetical protein
VICHCLNAGDVIGIIGVGTAIILLIVAIWDIYGRR